MIWKCGKDDILTFRIRVFIALVPELGPEVGPGEATVTVPAVDLATEVVMAGLGLSYEYER